jgi:DNA topoisomerase-1
VSKELIIVESPTKARHIKSLLNNEYDVISTYGHIYKIADTLDEGIGVDFNSWLVDYIAINQKTIEMIQAAALQSSRIYLASDPDREGEAISYALLKLLNLKNDKVRISYHEITKKAILEALQNPHEVDCNLSDAQETRAIIDKVVGYKLSRFVKSAIGAISAGRVQSVALRIICEREEEINNFIPQEYYLLWANFPNFRAAYDVSDVVSVDKPLAKKILEEAVNPFTVKDISVNEASRHYYMPYKTSTLLQDAVKKLKLTSYKTMQAAQSLFQSGLITYHRTTDTALDRGFIFACRKYIETNYGTEYMGYPISKESTGAHEGIRPTNINNTPDSLKLNPVEYKLYEMIYKQTLASVMSPSIRRKTDLIVTSHGWDFKATSTLLTFLGCEKVLPRQVDSDQIILPSLQVGSQLSALSVVEEQKFTTPPYRYNQASLIKKLEDENIGRPSTYAYIATVITTRDYVLVERGYYQPTQLGIYLNKVLVDNFDSFINIAYTSTLEEALDQISTGAEEKKQVLTSFYDKFQNLLSLANPNNYQALPKPKSLYPKPLEPSEKCPNCGGDLVLQENKYKHQEFIACSNFPKCKYVRSLNGVVNATAPKLKRKVSSKRKKTAKKDLKLS